MLRSRSPQFRIFFVIFLGIAGPGIMAALNHSETFWTLNTLLEVSRVSIIGAVAAVFSLFVEKPRSERRERFDDTSPSPPPSSFPGPPED